MSIQHVRAGYTPDPASAVKGAIADQQQGDRRLRGMIADLPDPEDVAYRLTDVELVALRSAYLDRQGLRVRTDYQRDLARNGLCEVRGPYLTAFGMAVRRVIMREDA